MARARCAIPTPRAKSTKPSPASAWPCCGTPVADSPRAPRVGPAISVWPPAWPVRYAVVASRGVLRSLGACFVRDEEVVGSNPATPTRIRELIMALAGFSGRGLLHFHYLCTNPHIGYPTQ